MAEELVPPGNSAVNQYTETIPTPGGSRNTENKGRKQSQAPHKALGSKNAQKLERHGSDGRAAAELAADTAPSTESAPSPEATDETDAETDGEDSGEKQAAGAGGGGGNDGERRGKASVGSAHAVSGTGAEQAAEGPEGSSGFGEVVGEATGGSSSGLGFLLPLLIVAVAIWSFAYLLRHRRQAG
jgi:hypothetical protein